MRIIEITGISGVGKSHVLNSLNRNIIIYDDKNNKGFLDDVRYFKYFFKTQNSFKILKKIFLVSLLLNHNILHKINFIRNSIKKIGRNTFILKTETNHKVIFIEEGIVHIYQNVIPYKIEESAYVRKLIMEILFLSKAPNEIIIIDSFDKTIKERLEKRGHSRFKNKTDIDIFVKYSREHILYIQKNYNTITIVNNNENNNLEKVFNDFL